MRSLLISRMCFWPPKLLRTQLLLICELNELAKWAGAQVAYGTCYSLNSPICKMVAVKFLRLALRSKDSGTMSSARK